MKLRLFSLIALLAIGMFAISCQNDKKAESGEAEASVTPKTSVEAQKTPQEAKQANQKKSNIPAGPTTTIAFEESVFDFGQIKDGDKVRHSFAFTNTGNEALLISNCKGSCGCTVPQCPKEPIAPGESGEIVVEYNSRNKGSVEGKVDQKFITVTANTTPATNRLTIKALVKKEATEEKAG